MKKQFCCEIFSDFINEAGQKGFSIIPTDIYSLNKYHFVLQARNLDLNEKNGKLFIAQQTIHYCPWCGTKLSDIIDNNLSDIIKIADKNKSFIVSVVK